MKISACLEMLQRIKDKHGDIECEPECRFIMHQSDGVFLIDGLLTLCFEAKPADIVNAQREALMKLDVTR